LTLDRLTSTCSTESTVAQHCACAPLRYPQRAVSRATSNKRPSQCKAVLVLMVVGGGGTNPMQQGARAVACKLEDVTTRLATWFPAQSNTVRHKTHAFLSLTRLYHDVLQREVSHATTALWVGVARCERHCAAVKFVPRSAHKLQVFLLT